MSQIALARDYVESSVMVHICQSQGVSLRPTVVNEMQLPLISTVLQPEEPIIVSRTKDQVILPVPINVLHVDRTAIPRNGLTGHLSVEDPLSGTWIARGLEPSPGRDNVGTPIAVHVPGAD